MSNTQAAVCMPEPHIVFSVWSRTCEPQKHHWTLKQGIRWYQQSLQYREWLGMAKQQDDTLPALKTHVLIIRIRPLLHERMLLCCSTWAHQPFPCSRPMLADTCRTEEGPLLKVMKLPTFSTTEYASVMLCFGRSAMFSAAGTCWQTPLESKAQP